MRPPVPYWFALVSLVWLLAACGARTTAVPSGQLVDQAAAEATAIIQSAQATALVLQAQAQANALIQQAGAQPATPSVTGAPPPVPSVTPWPQSEAGLPTVTGLASPPPAPASQGSSPQAVVTGTVELVGVGLAAEGGFIIVQFKAPPKEAQKWWQGDVAVVDEGTGATYNEVPVMPVIGPLIGRPVRAGQLGYVMLSNAPQKLSSGALVTVVLGDHKFEHVPVK